MRTTTRLLATALALGGLLTAQLGPADAAEQTRTKRVTRYNATNHGWERSSSGGGSVEFSEDLGGALGDGALVLESPGGRTARADLVKAADAGTTIADIEHLGFATYLVTPGSGSMETPTIRITVRPDPMSLETGEVVFRPSSAGAAPVVYDRWQTWSATEADRGWTLTGVLAGDRCTAATSSCSFGEIIDEVGGDAVVVDHRVTFGPIAAARTVAVDSVLIDILGRDGFLYDLELDQPAATDERVRPDLRLDLTTVDGDVLRVDPLGRYNVAQMRAVMRDDAGRALPGETVTFVRVDASWVRQELCQAVTEADGVASCRVPDAVRPTLTDHRVTARFLGDRERFLPAFSSLDATFTVA